MQSNSMPKAMVSKFDNTCRCCGDPVNRGDRIVWYTGTQTVFHAQCHNPLSPSFKILTDKQFEAAKQRNTASAKTLATLLRLNKNLEKAQQELAEFHASTGFVYAS